MNLQRPKIVGIVQARLGSTRLPLKSLLNLRGLPIINWVTTRARQSQKLDQLIVATPDTSLDQVLLEHLQDGGIPCMAGPENDVLARFVKVARLCEADLVVRICADNPLIWGEAIDRLVDFYLAGHWDYAWNHIPRNNSWPDGLGAEIVSARLLEQLADKAQFPSQREHIFNYLWDNAADFKMGTFDPREAWLRRPDIKLDIDSPDDYLKLARLPLRPDMNAKEIAAMFPVA